MSRAAPWGSLAAQSAAAVVVATVLRPALGSPSTAAAGLGAGAVLFLVLAGGVPLAPPKRSAAVLTGLVLVLLVSAAAEEVFWRAGVLGMLDRLLPGPRAVVLSALLFALAHARAQGRRGVVAHVPTGLAFGAAYLAGGLAAAAAAHATYNLLVLCAVRRRGLAPLAARAWAPPRPVERTELDVCARLRAVRKRFGETLALDGLDLELRRGEVLCLLGPNGAGKTTAVSLLLGLRRPDEGSVELFGAAPGRAARRRIGATPQDAAYPPTLRVDEILDLVAVHYAQPVDPDVLLRRFGLDALARRQAGGLSGGQRRRLALALAFAGSPELVVLDEPTVGLDVEARRGLWETVRTFAADGGSVLLTTHSLDEAEALASRIAVIARGRAVADGSVAEIRARVGLSRISIPAQPLPAVPTLVRRDDVAGRTTLVVRDPAAAVRVLVEADADLDALEIRPSSLEEAFLAMVGEAQR